MAHAEVEARLSDATSLNEIAALALFDDHERGGDVLPMINRRFRHSADDVYKRCNKGSHEGYEGDLRTLVDGAAALAADLRNLP